MVELCPGLEQGMVLVLARQTVGQAARDTSRRPIYAPEPLARAVFENKQE